MARATLTFPRTWHRTLASRRFWAALQAGFAEQPIQVPSRLAAASNVTIDEVAFQSQGSGRGASFRMSMSIETRVGRLSAAWVRSGSAICTFGTRRFTFDGFTETVESGGYAVYRTTAAGADAETFFNSLVAGVLTVVLDDAQDPVISSLVVDQIGTTTARITVAVANSQSDTVIRGQVLRVTGGSALQETLPNGQGASHVWMVTGLTSATTYRVLVGADNFSNSETADFTTLATDLHPEAPTRDLYIGAGQITHVYLGNSFLLEARVGTSLQYRSALPQIGAQYRSPVILTQLRQQYLISSESGTANRDFPDPPVVELRNSAGEKLDRAALIGLLVTNVTRRGRYTFVDGSVVDFEARRGARTTVLRASPYNQQAVGKTIVTYHPPPSS